MKFEPKRLGDVNMNIPLTQGSEVNLACLQLISPWPQQEESETAIVVGAGGPGFRTILYREMKNDARQNGPGRVQGEAGQCSGGGCLPGRFPGGQ
jgi:hypothetical protein